MHWKINHTSFHLWWMTDYLLNIKNVVVYISGHFRLKNTSLIVLWKDWFVKFYSYIYIHHLRETAWSKRLWLHVVLQGVASSSQNKLNIFLIYRRQKLDEIKRRKLKELRDAGVPDKYCNEVARRITAPPLYWILYLCN